jgi:hypothetical protein
MGFGVRQETVFSAFRARGISYAPCINIPGKHLFTVSPPRGVAHVEYIPPELGRDMPQRLSEEYKIPIIWFYNPLLIPGEEERGKPS